MAARAFALASLAALAEGHGSMLSPAPRVSAEPPSFSCTRQCVPPAPTAS
jgi:hypothetical protein